MPTLNWIGKDKVVNHHQDVPFRVLEHCYTHGETDSGNMIIHGDNLDALKALLPQYEGRIKCIYIDPPYNTGNENWVYNDNVNDPKIRKWLGEVVGREGEDLSRHDKWLCMMYPRLRLLQRLLADNGAIFISIDDNEQANLKLICDEVFGATNFVDSIIWEKRYSPQNAVQWFSESHDFIVVYAKSKCNWYPNLLARSDEMNARYRNLDNDPRGEWKPTDATAQAGHGTPTQFYELIAPNGQRFQPPNGRCWVYTKDRMQEMIDDNRVWFGSNGKSIPALKRFLSEVKQGIACQTIWKYKEVGHNQEGKQEIKSIFPEINPFETPKPTRLIERIIQLGTNQNSNDIILDSFAGSGTTAHAVLNMNKADGGNRRFILIEMEDYAENITAERVRRVIDGYKDTPGTGGGFDYFELGEPLLLEDGNLNDNVRVEKIYEYIWYTETKTAYMPQDVPYYLGTKSDTAYYFYYEPSAVTTLDIDFLRGLGKNGERFVIYADVCAMSDADLERWNIVFKKIPRDISKV